MDEDGVERVVVPWTPGRVIRVGAQSRSDVDAALDDLFGPPDTRGPNVFDVVLVVAGVASIAGGWGLVGGGLVLLGVTLPLRWVGERLQRAVRRRRYTRLLAKGQPLAVGHPATAALVAAYDTLLETVAALGEPARTDAVAAGHRAVVECASLLGGRAPATADESAYVARRTDAIRSAVAALSSGAGRDERVAAVRAREEVDAVTGRTSLDDLAAVARQVRRGS
jgi:hypothetical protein